MKKLLLLKLSSLIAASFANAVSSSPRSNAPGYRGPDMFKEIRIRVDADFYKAKSKSPKATLRLPWNNVKRFPSPYDQDDDTENEYYYDNLGFGQMSVLTTEYRFRGSRLVRTASIPVGESYGEKINTVYGTSDITCVFYIDRLGSEKYYPSEKKNPGSNNPKKEEEEEIRNWRPASEPFKLEEEASVSVHVDGLKCWNWFEGKEWARRIEGSKEIWDSFVEEQIYGSGGRDPYYRIYGDQPGLRSYFT